MEEIIRLEHNPRSASFRGVPMETGKTARQAQKVYETKTEASACQGLLSAFS